MIGKLQDQWPGQQPGYEHYIEPDFFEYGIAAYDLDIPKNWAGRKGNPEFQQKSKAVLGKIRAQATKDYLVHPLLSGPSALTTLSANLTANLARNLVIPFPMGRGPRFIAPSVTAAGSASLPSSSNTPSS